MSDEQRPPCPHKPKFQALGEALMRSTMGFVDQVREIDALPECDVTIVVASCACDCVTTVSDSPDTAHAAGEALLRIAKDARS